MEREQLGLWTERKKSLLSYFVKIISLVGLGGLLAAIIIPNYVKSRVAVSMDSCMWQVMWIQVAKDNWARENHKSLSDTPSEKEIVVYMGKFKPMWAGRKIRRAAPEELPTCFLTDKDYIIGAVGEPVKCPAAFDDVHNWNMDQLEKGIQFHYSPH